jgi:sporulation protein YlmC with PRC-barrel domain
MPFTPLSEDTEFAFPAGVFDVRGWEVRTTTDGEKVGEVEDLLIDDTGSIRYLDVDLATFRKHVLVPISRTLVDEAEDVVWVSEMSRSQFQDVPPYNHDPAVLTDDYQSRLGQAYPRGGRPGAGAAQQRAQAAREPGIASAPERAPVARPPSGPLASLAEVGTYEVASGNIDPRGWEVLVADQHRIGLVHDLLIDQDALKVRYLDCEVTTPEHRHPAGGRHILIPVGYARLDERDKIVYVDAISAAAAADLPSFPGLPLAPEAEDRIFEIFARGTHGEDRYRG